MGDFIQIDGDFFNFSVYFDKASYRVEVQHLIDPVLQFFVISSLKTDFRWL